MRFVFKPTEVAWPRAIQYDRPEPRWFDIGQSEIKGRQQPRHTVGPIAFMAVNERDAARSSHRQSNSSSFFFFLAFSYQLKFPSYFLSPYHSARKKKRRIVDDSHVISSTFFPLNFLKMRSKKAKKKNQPAPSSSSSSSFSIRFQLKESQ